MASGYIATNDDTWGSISRTLGVTEQSLTQRNKGINNVGAGMAFTQPWLPPRSWDKPAGPMKQPWWIENFLRLINARTTYTPIPWGDRGDTSAVNLNFRGAGQMLAPLGAAGAEETYPTGGSIVSQFLKAGSVLVGGGAVSDADRAMLGQAARAMSPASASEGFWRNRGIDPARQAALVGPKQLGTADRAMFNQAGYRMDAVNHWRSVIDAVNKGEDPGELRYSDIVRLAQREEISVPAMIALLEGEEGGYNKVGNSWVLGEAGGDSGERAFKKLSSTEQQQVRYRGYADIERKGKDGSIYTERRRYDSQGQLQSYAPRAKTSGRLGRLTRSRRLSKMRYGSSVTTKEQQRYYDRRDKWRKEQNESVSESSGAVGGAAQSYGNYANYSQPRSSQVYRNMYDPLGNVNWKID